MILPLDFDVAGSSLWISVGTDHKDATRFNTITPYSAHTLAHCAHILHTVLAPSGRPVRTQRPPSSHRVNRCYRRSVAVSAQQPGLVGQNGRVSLFARTCLQLGEPFIKPLSIALSQCMKAKDGLCQSVIFGDQIGRRNAQGFGEFPEYIEARAMHTALIARDTDTGRAFVQANSHTQSILSQIGTHARFAQSLAEDATRRFQAGF